MKRLLFITTVVITFLNLSIKAQSPSIMLEWGKAMGNANIDIASQSATDASGNVYTVGYFGGTVDFDPSASTYTLTSAGAYDMFIQKLDANGNFIWANRIGSTGNEAANTVFVDGSNNIYIGGYYNGTVDFDWNAGTLALSSGTVQSAFIAKYNSTGNITWLKGLIGTSTSNANSISVDNSGNVYTAGTIGQGVIDFDPNVGVSSFTVTNSGFFVQKLTSAGNLSWAKGFNSAAAGCYATTIDLDNAGNPAIGGVFAGSVDFDPNAGVTTYTTFLSHDDAFVIKLNSSGNYDFGFPLGVGSSTGNDEDAVNDIEFDASNNLYVCGYFSRTVDFDPSAATNTLTISGGITGSFTNRDAFIAKYSSTGLFNWVTNSGIGNSTYIDLASGLAINSSGDAFVGVSNFNSGGNLSSYKLCKFSSSGSLLFFKSFSNIESYDLNIDVAGNLYLAGYVEGSTDIDPSFFTNTIVSVAQKDALIAKFSECTTPITSGPLSGATALCNGSLNTYSIAAVGGALSYSWSNTASMLGSSTTNTISLTSGATATTGVISVTGYNHCGNSPTQTIQVTVTPNTTVNVASSSSSVCAGNSVTLTASGATTYSWASGETTISIVKNPTSTTVYTVTGYNGNCSNTKTLSINAVALPNMLVTVNQPTAGCAGSPVILTASGASTYTWNTGALTNSINVTPTVSTIYTVTGTNAAGCVKTTTAGVGIQSPVLVVSASAYSVCPGGVSTLSVSGAQSYTWNGPGGMTTGSIRNVSPTSTSTYVVGGTGFTGCITQTNIVVYVTAGITVSATASSTVSCSGAPVLITASGASTYAWVGTGVTTNTISVTPSTPTTYTVNGTSGTCSGTKTITIGVATSPNVNVTTSTPIICAGMSANLVASVSPVVPTMSYTWSTSQTTSNIAVTPTTTTTYTVIGRNFANGCTDNASITLSVSPQFTLSVAASSLVSCSGSPVILSVSGASTYTWNTGSNSNTVSVSPTTNTTYSVSGASGACSNSQTISVNASTNPSLSAATNNTLLCSSQSALLTANGAGVVSYLWNTGSVSPNITVTPTTTTVYSVTGTDALGCSTTIAITQYVSTCTGLNEVENTNSLFTVYPNPNSGEFTMTTIKGSYSLINSIGEIVKVIEIKNDNEYIDVKDLPQGVYYIIGKIAKAKIIITK